MIDCDARQLGPFTLEVADLEGPRTGPEGPRTWLTMIDYDTRQLGPFTLEVADLEGPEGPRTGPKGPKTRPEEHKTGPEGPWTGLFSGFSLCYALAYHD